MGKPKALWIQDNWIVCILEATIHTQAGHASLMHWSVQILRLELPSGVCGLGTLFAVISTADRCCLSRCQGHLDFTNSGRACRGAFPLSLSKRCPNQGRPPVLQAFALLGQFDDSYCQNVLAVHSAALPGHWRLTASETATEHVWWTTATKGAKRSVLNEAIWEAVLGVEDLIEDGVAQRMVSLLFEVKRHKAFVRCSFTTGSCIFAACRREKPTHETSFQISAHAIARKSTNQEIGKRKGLPSGPRNQKAWAKMAHCSHWVGPCNRGRVPVAEPEMKQWVKNH